MCFKGTVKILDIVEDERYIPYAKGEKEVFVSPLLIDIVEIDNYLNYRGTAARVRGKDPQVLSVVHAFLEVLYSCDIAYVELKKETEVSLEYECNIRVGKGHRKLKVTFLPPIL